MISRASTYEPADRRSPVTGHVFAATGAIALVVVMARIASGDGGPLALALLVAGLGGVLVFLKPEIGVLVLTTTFFVKYPGVLGGSGLLTLNSVLGFILVGQLLARAAHDRRLEFLEVPQVKLLLLIGAVVAVNLLLVESPPLPLDVPARHDMTSNRIYDLVSKTLFVAFVVTFVRTRGQLLALAACVVACTLVTAPAAAWTALTAEGKIEAIRASSDGSNANRLAFVSVFALAIIGHAVLTVRSNAARVLGGLAIAVLVLTVVLTASRSGALGLVILALALMTRARVRLRTRVLCVAALVVITVLVLAVVPAAFVDRLTNFNTEADVGASTSLAGRANLASIALRMAIEHPFLGVGYGSFRLATFEGGVPGVTRDPHNSYLLALAEGGLVLFVPFAILFWVTWRQLSAMRRLAAERPVPGLGWLVEAVQTVFALLLFFSLFADLWQAVYLFLVIGMAASMRRLYAEAAPAAVPAPARVA